MSFISMIPEEQAGPELKRVYEEVRSGWGQVLNFWQAQGRRPDLIKSEVDLYVNTFTKGSLPQELKEQIGIVVAGINTSSYCVALHMEVLRRMGIEKQISRKLATDYEHAKVEPKVMALFQFAAKLTKTPGDIVKEDFETVRMAGWDDEAVYETVMSVAVMGLFNRVSLGLGLVADF